MLIAKMRTRRRKREAAGATLAEEKARGGEEMEPVLDVGEAQTQEQEQREGREGRTPPSLR